MLWRMNFKLTRAAKKETITEICTFCTGAFRPKGKSLSLAKQARRQRFRWHLFWTLALRSTANFLAFLHLNFFTTNWGHNALSADFMVITGIKMKWEISVKILKVRIAFYESFCPCPLCIIFSSNALSEHMNSMGNLAGFPKNLGSFLFLLSFLPLILLFPKLFLTFPGAGQGRSQY